MSPSRMSFSDLPESGRRVNREKYVSAIVRIIQQTIQTATNIREFSSAGMDEVRDTFVVLTGGAGFGKTVLLEILASELPQRVSCRVTNIIDAIGLIDGPAHEDQWKHALETCAGEQLHAMDVAERSIAMTHTLGKSSQPVVVLLDNLETLNNPLFGAHDVERDRRVLAVKNLLLGPLLQLFHVPIIIIAAARAMPEEPLPYLAEIDFQDALLEVPIKNTDEEVNQVLGITTSDERTQSCGGSLLVAAERGPDWHNPAVVRALIDEFMRREPESQRGYFEALLVELSRRESDRVSKSQSKRPMEPKEIRDAAQALRLPAYLQKRITARLVASTFLQADALGYRVYSPLANLLREVESYNRGQ